MEEIMVFGVVLKMRKNEMKMRFFLGFCFALILISLALAAQQQ
jgi:hypothetical protein